MDALRAHINSLIDCEPIYVDQCLLSFLSVPSPSMGYLIGDQIFSGDGFKDYTETDYKEFEVVATKNNVSERSSQKNSSSLYNLNFQYKQFKLDNNEDTNDTEELVFENFKRKIKTDKEFPKLSEVYGKCDDDPDIVSSGTVTPDSELSYAKMLEKATDVPDQINVKVGQMVWQMKFDNYHMVVGEKLRMLWCLACKKQIINKVEHTNEMEHLKNLKRCKVLTKYPSHFVREIDSFYHCGHCNMLKTIKQIDNHLAKMHPKKTKVQSKTDSSNGHKVNTVLDIADKTAVSKMPKLKREPYVKCDVTVTNQEKATITPDSVNAKNTLNNDEVTKESVTPKTVAEADDSARLNVNNNTPYNSLDTLIVIHAFGVKMFIPLASYNLICKGPLGAYCVLCDIVFKPEAILLHVQDVRHVQIFCNTPLIAQFNCHLIRLIRNMAHCALCNQLMHTENVQLHILESLHLSYFSFAITTALALQNPSFIGESGQNHQNNVHFNAQNVAPNTINHDQQNNSKGGAEVNKNDDILVDSKTVVDVGTTALSNLNKQTKENNSSTPEKDNTKNKLVNDTLNNNEAEKPKRLILGQNSDPTDLEENENDVTDDDVNIDEGKSLQDAKMQSELFDFEELVLVRYKSSFKRVTNASFNSVCPLGLSHYCFLCDRMFKSEATSKHVNCKNHIEKLKDAVFLTDYDYNSMPVRKNRSLYHCLCCNVIITSKDEISEHMNWKVHELRRKSCHLTKKKARNEIVEGMEVFEITLGRDNDLIETKMDTSIRIVSKVFFVDEKGSDKSLGTSP